MSIFPPFVFRAFRFKIIISLMVASFLFILERLQKYWARVIALDNRLHFLLGPCRLLFFPFSGTVLIYILQGRCCAKFHFFKLEVILACFPLVFHYLSKTERELFSKFSAVTFILLTLKAMIQTNRQIKMTTFSYYFSLLFSLFILS